MNYSNGIELSLADMSVWILVGGDVTVVVVVVYVVVVVVVVVIDWPQCNRQSSDNNSLHWALIWRWCLRRARYTVVSSTCQNVNKLCS